MDKFYGRFDLSSKSSKLNWTCFFQNKCFCIHFIVLTCLYLKETFFVRTVVIKIYTQKKPRGKYTTQKPANDDAQHSMPITQVNDFYIGWWFVARSVLSYQCVVNHSLCASHSLIFELEMSKCSDLLSLVQNENNLC